MTTLVVTVWALLIAYAIYLSALTSRAKIDADGFIDGGGTIPAWGFIFAAAGVVVAGLNLGDHLVLAATYGLQYTHTAVGLVLVALVAALVHKRLWLASRIARLRTAGELLGAYYGSVTIRLYLLAVLFLFSVPVAAYALAQIGALAEAATGNAVSARMAIWTVAIFLFLHAVVGGWRAIVYFVAAQSLLVMVLLAFTGGLVGLAFDLPAMAGAGFSVVEPILADRLPGVIQFTAGLGKELPHGGPWTTVAVLSHALSLMGLALAPSMAFLAISSNVRRGFAFAHVWAIAGIAAGVLLFVSPMIAAEMSAGAAAGEGAASMLAGLAARLGELDALLGVVLVVMLLASLQIAVGFFAASGANIAAVELVQRYLLPDLSAEGLKLAARVTMAIVFAAVALTASFTPLSAAIFSTLALSLAAQLLPAFIGLCWVPWVSRSAVLAGLIVGTIMVVFTEPFGLIAFEALFVELPWGRWPLTVHSAGWGLVFNVAACLLVALFTRKGAEREDRDRLHDEFRERYRTEFGGRAARGAMWSLALIWAFLALGPGAILGNNFFSQPIFAGGAVETGLPSLLVWQVVFWFAGVLIVWWLAYFRRMSIIDDGATRHVSLELTRDRLERGDRPAWIARLIGRVSERAGDRGRRRID